MKSLRNIRAIAFDAVGTLIHPAPPAPVVYFQVGKRFGSRLSLPVITERFRAAFQQEEQRDRLNQFHTSELREVTRWRTIVANVLDDLSDPDACFQVLFEHFSRPSSWSCEPDTGRLFEPLKARGYRLAIASNYDQRLRSVLAGLPALRGIERLVISSEVGWRKPAAGFFAALCAALGTDPDETLHVGDDPINDYAGATSAGLAALVVDPREQSVREGVKRVGCLAELHELLKPLSSIGQLR
jgi:putative hydrolase of the HAD superfamily